MVNLKFKSMKNLKNDLVIDEVKKDWLVVCFGSRWDLDVDIKFMNELDILDMYNDFCKEMRDEDMEYFIEEFGECNKFVDGMWSVCMSDDWSYWYIDKSKFSELCDMFENRVNDEIVYNKLVEFEEKYDVVI